MVDWFDDDDQPDPLALAEDFPTLAAVARFARMIPDVSWFAAVGEPLTAAERADAEAYVLALGFPDAGVASVSDWEEAETAAKNPDWNTSWWEVEEQLRAALTVEASEIVGDDDTLMVALTNVTSTASEVVHGAAAVAASQSGVADPALIRAAAGAATQACYQAALVLAAGEEEDHAFALKYRLFEAGRWPLGIVGATFNIF